MLGLKEECIRTIVFTKQRNMLTKNVGNGEEMKKKSVDL